MKMRGSSSVGRASASQAEGRGFEPRLPLHPYVGGSTTARDALHLHAQVGWSRD